VTALTITSRKLEGVTILDLSGRITLGDGSVLLREAIRNLLVSGSAKVVLNLAEVSLIDSSGLGELVSAYTAARGASGGLKLLSPPPKILNMLQLTKLDTILDIYDDEASAIESSK
jgi:anti-sigma B factor antagonist